MRVRSISFVKNMPLLILIRVLTDIVGSQSLQPSCTNAGLQSTVLNISLVVISDTSTEGYQALPFLGPALSLAVEHVSAKYNGAMNFSLHFIGKRGCKEVGSNAISMISEWHYRERNDRDLTIYIVPSCADDTEMPYFHTQWDTLWISTVSAGPKIRRRDLYPTWISTNFFLVSECAELFLEILNKYNWTSIAVIIDNSPPPFYFILATTFLNIVKSQKHIVSIVRNIETKAGSTGFRSILESIRTISRVVLYFGAEPALWDFLWTAYMLNMTNGEYVYLLVENNMFRPISWQNSDRNDSVLLQAFHSVLIVNPSENSENVGTKMQLGKEFLRRTEQDYNFTYPISNQPYALIVGSYMTVFALAEAINDTITSGDRANCSGVALARLLLNRTFTDDFGNSMYIDSEGQRRTDFTVSFFNANGSREPLLRKFGQTGDLLEVTRLLVWVNSSFPPPNEPYCGYLNQKLSCLIPSDNRSAYLLTAISTSLCLAVGIMIIGWIAYNKFKAKYQLLRDPWWQIQLHEPNNRRTASCRSLLSKIYSDHFSYESSDLPTTFSWTRSFCGAVVFGTYRTKPVMGWKLCHRNQPVGFPDISENNELLVLLQKLSRMEHLNICQFAGLAITRSSKGIYWISAVIECPSRGALPDIFDSYASRDAALLPCLAHDYLKAVRYIHNSSLQFHGRISVLTCWVDKHFTLKLAHLASDRLRQNLHTACGFLSTGVCQNIVWESFYWSPPDTGSSHDSRLLQMVDIYSSGLVLLDILTKGRVLESVRSLTKTGRSLRELSFGTLLSSLPEFEVILRSCIALNSPQRPDIKSLLRALAPMLSPHSHKTTSTFFDQIYARLEGYSAELECQVTKRTSELMEEMDKCDAIINQFLPRSVAKQLRAGEKVLPEFFECATILFTDLHGFADFVKIHAPEMTIAVTSATEVCIDKLTTECDVYKVEAVNDSFMVASGIPERIGIKHIERIASFATRLVELQTQFTFLENLRFKTGIHSGPCAAGLMGLKRPRYCLFGDTVNMASRMCSHGLPGRIHISPESQLLLEQFSQFIVEARGLQAIKGKYEIATYWLLPFPQK
ncbi:atrial natriuretic peptide receptor 1-like [Paramacrobiotus metropolitanus]|uniref:atrial natriuretic peptide receptor 1-like n=1 Tax=Paramacrobiotus metropolitanus TaxID=2943436 RepID=UPI0024457413|nr:atrial natriuretic peptide receptor 1-like [Paramacrobiotus metropolitanus]